MMPKMAARRIPNKRLLKLPLARAPKRLVRNNQGMTKSLHTMVDTAMASTMTMPVAADKPPTNASRAKAVYPSAKGKDNTKVSGFMLPGPKYIKPPSAIGNTKRLIKNKYRGKTQTARLRWRSSTFSTTITWN